MTAQNNHIIAPLRFSVYEDRIIVHASDKAAYCLPYDTIQCVLFEGFDDKTHTTTELRPEAVLQDAQGYLIIYQADGSRWEMHMFRCKPGAGALYEVLFRHLELKRFEYANEAVYRKSRVYW